MSDSGWRTAGSTFRIEQGGRTWVLELDQGRPGLVTTDHGQIVRLLGLRGVSMSGHHDDRAFQGTLVSSECRRARAQAIYVLPDWDGLSVRAAWEPAPDRDGFDLEVQLWAGSASLIRRLEVMVESAWPVIDDEARALFRYRVEPRDRAAAASSYDGREPEAVLQSLTTLPIPAESSHALEPLIRRSVPDADSFYAEMVQPNDCARRVVIEPTGTASSTQSALWCRHGLFGHDIERGVILRGRMRGIWIASSAAPGELRRRYEAFLSEPPPLGP